MIFEAYNYNASGKRVHICFADSHDKAVAMANCILEDMGCDPYFYIEESEV